MNTIREITAKETYIASPGIFSSGKPLKNYSCKAMFIRTRKVLDIFKNEN